MPLLDTITNMKTSIFINDFLDNDHQDQLDSGPANNATSRTAVSTNSDVISDDTSAHPLAAGEPVPLTISKKRGQPSKKAQAGTSKESGQFDLLSACIEHQQVKELVKKPGGAVTDKLDEVVDIIEVKHTGLTWKTYRMVDNVTCLSPQL